MTAVRYSARPGRSTPTAAKQVCRRIFQATCNSPVARPATPLVVSRRNRSERSPGFPRKEEPVLAGFELSPTAPLDELGNYPRCRANFSSSRLRKSRPVTPPSAGITPPVCAIRISDWRPKREGEPLPLRTKTRCLAPAAAGRRRRCSLSPLGEASPSELPVGLSVAAGRAERTLRRSPAVTTTLPAPLPQTWRSSSPSGCW